jgi:hypothetical protein
MRENPSLKVVVIDGTKPNTLQCAVRKSNSLVQVPYSMGDICEALGELLEEP